MNEAIFFITIIVDLSFILLLFRLGGRSGLVASIIINIILVSVFGAELISLFGFITNAGNVFYASIFLAFNLLVEHNSRAEGYKTIAIGFCALVLFVLMGQFTLNSVSIPETREIFNAMQIVFKSVPRIALASMVAYLIALTINVYLYDLLKRNSAGKRLWLRSIFGSSVAQGIDSIIFFSIAFSGLVSFSVLLQTIVVGFLLKFVGAFLSTPFLYLGQLVKEK